MKPGASSESIVQPQRQHRRWVFGSAVLDESSRELLLHGQPVAIDNKLLEVLLVLLQHPNQLISKDQLAAACWPGRILSDSVLSKTLSRLREVLADADQSMIRTLHGQGYRLTVPVKLETVPPSKMPRDKSSEAERRQITVMCCDFGGSTSLSEQSDPEAFRVWMSAYQSAARGVIERYEGHLSQVLGDGLVVFFGYPLAHDDDAERAVRCGYELLRALKRIQHDPDSSARIGIHTGPVVVGPTEDAGGRSETLAMGHAPRLAAKLASAAEPGTLLISSATHKLVPGLFITEALPPLTFKGIEEPLRALQVMQPSGNRTRLEAAAQLTPFVGREQELSLLQERWQRVQEQQGQACLITAEPGFGKSRLLRVLREHIAHAPHTWLECRCSPLAKNSAYQPIIELLKKGLRIKDGDSNQDRLQSLEQALDADKQDGVPLLAPLLNISTGEKYPPSPYTAELQRRKTQGLLIGLLIALEQHQALLLVVEDLHWSDPSTLELLARLLDQIPGHRILLLLTARPEYRPDWPHRSHLSPISLPPLRRSETGRMLVALTGNKPLPAELERRILQRAGGVPLFLEELAKSLLESGQLIERDGRLDLPGSIDALAIPETLQASLNARMDRLGDAKPLIQLCAVIGREIPHRLLQAVAEIDDAMLNEDLQTLTDSQLLFQRGSAPDAAYLFKHALIQDTAYNSLLKTRQQKLHGNIAEAIKRLLPEQAAQAALHGARLAEHYGELAHHYERSGNAEMAARYAQLAGESAMRFSANREAVAHLSNAVRLIDALPSNPERLQLLISLHVSLGTTLSALNGYLDREASAAFHRARDLCRDADPMADLGSVLFGLAGADLVRGEFVSSLETTKQMDAWADTAFLPAIRVGARFIAGQANVFMGRLDAAEQDSRRAVEIYERENCRGIALVFGEDAWASAKATLAWTLWLRGYPDQAAAERERSMVHARQLGHVFSHAVAGALNSYGCQLGRDKQAVIELARMSAALCSEHGFPWYGAWAEILLGWTAAEEGHAVEAIPRIRAAMEIFNGGGAALLCPWALSVLATAQGKAGKADDALATVAEARAAATRTGELTHLAELHRLRGELILQSTRGIAADEAQTCFRHAIDIARGQQAKSWELRAATSLASLLQGRGEQKEARAILAEIYGWFTEGFDTPDLREAKTLLDALASDQRKRRAA
ncbi:MAG: AAA family ATPase [Panacagrimonas sp.]